MKYLDVIVPVKNEADNVGDLVSRIHTSLRDADISHQIIFVDDNSTDSTVDFLNELAKDFPVKVYKKQGKKGKAYSILEGVRYSTADTLAMIDGDLQYPPEALSEMFEKTLEHGVVVAKRQKYNDSSTRKLFSKTFKYFFGKLLFNFNCDVQSGLKLFKREIIERVEEKDVSGWTLDIPLLHTAIDMGYTIGEVDISFEKRTKGASKVNTLMATAEIASKAVAIKMRPKKVYIMKQENNQMQGAGVAYNKKRFVTHTTLHPDKSAIRVLSHGQKIWLWLLAISLILLLIWNLLIGLQIVVAILSFIYFVDVLFNFYLIYKSLHHPPEITISEEELAVLNESELPVYTILCPLYREASVLPLFLDSISKMDYPKEKMEVMLMLEEDDVETQEAAKELNLPSYVKVVVVPDSQPKTKPKACNYGLTQATGEYLVIYDAEDIPDPLQLKKAYLAFKKADSNVVCLQAKLNYHNPYQNVLTRLFTAEYSLWFDVTLTGLQSIATTIPLGGTSNHFKTKDLHELQGWDPFNVTEDCDLGLRLFNKGYKTAIIDSTTLEEANSNVRNWIRQRSRWIKGYMQTYLVHMRNPVELARNQKWHSLVFQMVVGGKIAFIFINPFLWVMTIAYFVFRPILGPAIESLYPVYIFYMAGFSLVFGNFLFMYYYMIGVAKREQWSLMKFVFLVPLYWIMVSWAGMIALYQLIVKPHYWEKTIHGLHLQKAMAEVKVVAETIVEPVTEALEQKATEGYGTRLRNKITRLMGERKVLIGGSILALAIMVSNVLNFLFNTFLGRTITIEEFGVISLFSSLFSIIYIPIFSFSSVITHRAAFLFGKHSRKEAYAYFNRYNKMAFYYGFGATVLWILLIPFLSNFFQISSLIPFLIFSPVWLTGMFSANSEGYLKSVFSFEKAAVLIILSSVAKLIYAYVLISLGYQSFVLAAIPLAVMTEFVLTAWFIFREKNTYKEALQTTEKFDWKFFSSSFLISISTVSFFTLDVLLAKHFLSPVEAGQYGLLSLVGKIAFFLTSLLNPFMLPLVSRNQGANKSSKWTFLFLFGSEVSIAGMAFLVLGAFGFYTVPLLFGEKTLPILNLLPLYVATMVLFSISRPIVNFFQAKNNHSYVFVGFLVAILQVILIGIFHTNLSEIVLVMFAVSFINLGFIGLVFYVSSRYPAAFSNFQDLYDLLFYHFRKKTVNETGGSKKHILIFNWRDIKHTWAGGAEIYIHELAKKWVESENHVTVFCGNDGNNPRNELIDGVQMVRRGGFYTVYVWAFFYYILRFRGRYDVIIDSENGIPFFTPLFVTKPKFLLIHHIHQEVFREHLSFPMAFLASLLEGKLMPMVYKSQQVITVSQSSKTEILKLSQRYLKSIDIIHPGIHHENFTVMKKTANPTFLYLGRLQPYKNVDIAIKAFKNVLKEYPAAEFHIAGTGVSQGALETLAQKLDISEKVRFWGRVSEEQKKNLLSTSWAMIQPSMVEGWGITVIEANASKTPVIASDVNGLRDSIINGKTGMLVKPKNIEDFTGAMIKIIKNKRLRNSLSKEAYIWSKNFSWTKSAEFFNIFIDDYSKPEKDFRLIKAAAIENPAI